MMMTTTAPPVVAVRAPLWLSCGALTWTLGQLDPPPLESPPLIGALGIGAGSVTGGCRSGLVLTQFGRSWCGSA